MFKLWTLVRVQFKSSFQLFDGRQKVKPIHIIFALLIGLSLLPSFFSLSFLVLEGLRLLIPIGQAGIVLSLWLVALNSLVFFFALFMIPAVFYFSKDTERLIVLPVSSMTLLLSKWIIVYVYELLTVSLMSLPVLIPYVYRMQPSLGFYGFAFILLLSLPIVPLALAGLIVMLVMGLLPRFKNRDLFNLLSSFIILFVSIAFSLSISRPSSLDEAALIQALLAGNNSLTSLITSFIPSVRYAIDAVVNFDWIALSVYLVINGLALAGFAGLGRILYFKGVIGVSETGSKRQHLRTKAFESQTQTRPIILSYALKELRILFRTPIYLFNNVSTALLMPVLLLPILLTQASNEDALIQLIQSIDWQNPSLTLLVILIGFSVGLGMTALNLITPTAISREGLQVEFMKYIPMAYLDQVWAKIISGLVISLVGLLSMVLPLAFWFQWSLGLSLMTLIAGLFGVWIMNLLGMMIDLIRPKLIWENETVPVKQNLNALYSMGSGLIIGFVFFSLYNYLGSDLWVLVLLYGLMGILSIALVYGLQWVSFTFLSKLEV